MQPREPRFRTDRSWQALARRLLLAVAGVALLSACGTGPNQERPPPCPQARVLGDTDRLVQFREGPGRDVVDIEFDAEIVQLAGECVYSDDKDSLAVSFFPAFRITMGAADDDRRAQFSYFVAVVRRSDNAILNKEVFDLTVVAPPNQNQLRFRDNQIDLLLPLGEDQTGESFQLLLGFQLDEQQLEYNRRQPSLR